MPRPQPRALSRWGSLARSYLDSRVIILFFLGFSSGLPFVLVISTLSLWLIEAGLNKAAIGSFMLVSLPYSGKFLWATLVDHARLPGLTRWLGQRRSWLCFSQIGSMAGLCWLGHTNPATEPWMTAMAAMVVSLCSATQDIAAEAYRAEVLKPEILGAGAGMNGFGYRLGMLVGGGGALYLSAVVAWVHVYEVMALGLLAGLLAVLWIKEPRRRQTRALATQNGRSKRTELKTEYRERVQVFLDITFAFLRQPLAWVVLVFVFFFKMISTVMIVMTPLFLTDLGFGKVEIANIAKVFGIVAMMLGGMSAGVSLSLLGMRRSLWLCLLMKAIASGCLMLQARLGYDPAWAIVTMGIEHVTSGLGSTVLVAYLSGLCRAGYSGMDFALLSSFGSLARVTSSVLGGWLAYEMPWLPFFGVVGSLILPCALLLWGYGHVFTYWQQKPDLRPRTR